MAHPYREPSAPRRPSCPRCRVALTTERVEERALSRCERCAGLWLPRDLFLDALIDPGLQAGLEALDRPASGDDDDPTPLLCPDCGAKMNRGPYARTSGVMVDVCRPHGVWLDPSELTRILSFANANQPVASSPAPPAAGRPLDARELHAALFPQPYGGGFWDRLGRLFNAVPYAKKRW